MGKEKAWKVALIACLLLTMLMGIWMCRNTSPLYQHCGYDNGIFFTIGRGITQGKVPYVDLIENKGPLLFLLVALPQMFFSGTTGIFLLQEAMMLASVCMVFLCVRWLMGQRKGIVTAVLAWAAYMLDADAYGFGYHFCEEYDLFFMWIAICMAIHLFTEQTGGNGWRPFLLGVSVMAILLIKASDLLGVGITALFYLLCLIRQKKPLLPEILWFAAGMASIALPIIVYLWRVNALEAMIQEYLVNNVIHVIRGSGDMEGSFLSSRIQLFKTGEYGLLSLLHMGLMMAALGAASIQKKHAMRPAICNLRPLAMYFGCLCVANFLTAYVASSNFTHHLMMCRTTLVLAVIVAVGTVEISIQGRKFWPVTRAALLVLMTGWIGWYNIAHINRDDWITSARRQAVQSWMTEFSDVLHQHEDSIYTIGVSTDWYWFNQVYPAYPYFNLVGFISDHVGVNQAEAFETALCSQPFEVLVVHKGIEEYADVLTSKTISFIQENYELIRVDSRQRNHLLLLKTERADSV